MNKQVHLKNDGNVWYHPKAISNILSMRNVKMKNCIIYESENGDIFIVINTRPGAKDMILTANKDGLYYNNRINNKGVYMLITVKEKRMHYTHVIMSVQR